MVIFLQDFLEFYFFVIFLFCVFSILLLKKEKEGGTKQNMDLREWVQMFLEDCGCSKSNFCRKVNMSLSYFIRWQEKRYDISEKIQERIKNYLSEVYRKYE